MSLFLGGFFGETFPTGIGLDFLDIRGQATRFPGTMNSSTVEVGQMDFSRELCRRGGQVMGNAA